MFKRIVILMIALSVIAMMSGCGRKQIFTNPDDKYTLHAVEEDALESDTFYIKDGTRFYAAYEPNGKAAGKSNKISSDRILWTGKDFSLIPTYYQNEFIAYASEKTALENVVVERYKDLGWSLGIYGATIDEDGYIAFSVKENCIKDSDIYLKLKDQKSDSIRITAINGVDIIPENLLSGGVLAGLSEGEAYELAFYAGTHYGTIKTIADKRFFQSYETYNIEKGEDTKNGYVKLTMQKDAKNGYYRINGEGMFIYYDTPKSEVSADTNMNEPYYKSLAEQLYANSQQFVISVPIAADSALFKMEYDATEQAPEDVVAVLTAPNGTAYDLQQEKPGELSVGIDSVMSGRWTLNVMPKDLNVNDVRVDPVYKNEESKKESFTYVLEEGTNVKFSIGFEGEGEVWGTITFEDGTTKEFEVDKKNSRLTYTYDYTAPGTYTVDIYHYADTSIEDEVQIEEDFDNLEEEIITVEG